MSSELILSPLATARRTTRCHAGRDDAHSMIASSIDIGTDALTSSRRGLVSAHGTRTDGSNPSAFFDFQLVHSDLRVRSDIVVAHP
jgi:hypothetical protein